MCTKMEDQAATLYAIQKIPGNTACEKFQWMGKYVKSLYQQAASGDLGQLSLDLLPVLRVEIAIRKKIHEDITWALKSQDSPVINRALRASWFFDGSYKNIVDIDYFCENVFPHISLKTRLRVINTLAIRLIGKDSSFAQQLFTMIQSTYSLQQALPLIVACDKDFVYQTIVEMQIALPYSIVKKIFLIDPDFVIRYLKLSKVYRNIKIHKYENLLPLLIKKRVKDFTELCEMFENDPPRFILSNNCAERLLKKGLEYVTKKPHLYIRILPLKKINATQMESIFPGLLPEQDFKYDVDEMMKYLEYYPNDKKSNLILKSYKDKYGTELLDTQKNVTWKLLQVLPTEERIKQVRIKIKQNTSEEKESNMDYEHQLICYLPLDESLPVLKKEIAKTSKKEDRLGLMWQMLYSCKINKDDDALLNTLLYFMERHKNEEYWVYSEMITEVVRLYDIPHLNEKQANGINSIIYDINLLFYIKHGTVEDKVIEALIHYRFLHEMPVRELIEIYLESQNNKSFIILNEMFDKYPKYERQCIVMFLDVIKSKLNSIKWKPNRDSFLFNIVDTMYKFNKKYKKSGTNIKQLTIKDYPWLMNNLRELIWNISEDKYYNYMLKQILRENEPDLYDIWYCKNKRMELEVIVTLDRLKRNSKHVLHYWKEYLFECKVNYRSKSVHRFVRALRWYNDIPIKFMKECMLNYESDSKSLIILSILLHGQTLTILLNPLIIEEITIDVNNPDAKKKYEYANDMSLAMNLSNPPICPSLLMKLCKGDYLSIALRSFRNITIRSSMPVAISFAQELMKQRVSVKKHALEIIFDIAPARELIDTVSHMWSTEKHPSIRKILLSKAKLMLRLQRSPESWSLISTLLKTMKSGDEEELESNIKISDIPNKYIAGYIMLCLDVIDKVEANELESKKFNKYIEIDILSIMGEETSCDFPFFDELIERLLRKYFFHTDDKLCGAMRLFALNKYLGQNQRDNMEYSIRLPIFTNFFVSKIKSGWNVPHPKKRHFYPVNYGVNRFVASLIKSQAGIIKHYYPQLIVDMLKIFLSVLTPQMDPASYLLLIYANERLNTKTPYEFGLQISKKMTELIEIFSPPFISFIAKILKYFLRCNPFTDVIHADYFVIEGLIETDVTESCFVAAEILSEVTENYTPQFYELFEKLDKIDHLAIKSILWDSTNKRPYEKRQEA